MFGMLSVPAELQGELIISNTRDGRNEALSTAGCAKIFDDTISGTTVDRPGLAKVLEHPRAGDARVVWKIHRLGRTVKNLINFTEQLHTDGVWASVH